jgi:hypothetical protein
LIRQLILQTEVSFIPIANCLLDLALAAITERKNTVANASAAISPEASVKTRQLSEIR